MSVTRSFASRSILNMILICKSSLSAVCFVCWNNITTSVFWEVSHFRLELRPSRHEMHFHKWQAVLSQSRRTEFKPTSKCVLVYSDIPKCLSFHSSSRVVRGNEGHLARNPDLAIAFWSFQIDINKLTPLAQKCMRLSTTDRVWGQTLVILACLDTSL